MKSKLLIASALIALGCGSIFAQNTLQKPADQVRIYINPGHGSWGPNNRPMQTIGRDEYNAADVDTTGFFESNTNLLKGYSLLDRLVEAGVPFDRTKNQTGDNPARTHRRGSGFEPEYSDVARQSWTISLYRGSR